MQPQAIVQQAPSIEVYARSVVASILDRLSVPYLTLAQDGKVLWANAQARAILEQGHHVGLSKDDGLTFPVAALAEKLARFLSEPAVDGVSAELSVPGDPDRGPLHLSLYWYYMPQYPGAAASAPIAVMFFRNASQDETIATLRTRFGLTEREVRVVRAVLAGHDLRDYARENVVSIHTVRKQLNTAMRKTGVSSRFQLRLLIEKLSRTVAQSS